MERSKEDLMEELMVELKENLLMEELMAKLKENLAKGRNKATAKEAVLVKEGSPVQEGVVAEMKDDNSLEDILEKEKVVMDDLVEVDGIAGRTGLHKEKETNSEFKKGDKVKHYPCKESDCGKKFSAKRNLNLHIQTVHLKEKPYHSIRL